jgi:hypothetical protein
MSVCTRLYLCNFSPNKKVTNGLQKDKKVTKQSYITCVTVLHSIYHARLNAVLYYWYQKNEIFLGRKKSPSIEGLGWLAYFDGDVLNIFYY